MEEWVSQDEQGEYELLVSGDGWRQFCRELEQAIREEFEA
jgi:hypothetical protein